MGGPLRPFHGTRRNREEVEELKGKHMGGKDAGRAFEITTDCMEDSV